MTVALDVLKQTVTELRGRKGMEEWDVNSIRCSAVRKHHTRASQVDPERSATSFSLPVRDLVCIEPIGE